MRKFSVFFFLVFFSGISCWSQKPNVILIMTDDLGWGDVGFNGNPDLKTPHLDKLAKKGVVLNRFYAASAVCSPTRASVITGRNPYRMGIHTANHGHMKKEEITLPEILQKGGYMTGHFGKWHLGTLTTKQIDANRGGRPENTVHFTIPSEHGYDVFFCTESKVPTYDPMIKPTEFEEDESLRFGWSAVGDREVESYGTYYWEGTEEKVSENLNGDNSRVITDRVLSFIHEASIEEKPFFTTVWYHTPHLPVVADHKWRKKYRNYGLQEQLYYGTISALDMQIGRLWKFLRKRKLAKNTIIWFCSDNGPERETPGSAGSYRERKRSLHEGGVRVPAFVLWKDQLKGGRETSLPMVTSDYVPTVLEMVGLEYPELNRPLDGIDLWNSLLQRKEVREKSIGFLFREKMSWVNDRYKLISKDAGVTFELYDLIDDPREKKNCIEERSLIASQMEKEFLRWRESVMRSEQGEDY